ncbi:rRNA maturation RNase YbeY [Haloplasma contractile]|uniref:Endoribonuclease YbeY n=1 Tax=Haloplasma contractile SSD-17B TaxID=1033810 RepID=U2FSA3_9MOLU|nr:rRNA maturation RNase YbeY [Haloplasma contractile]ERJ13824.1 Endoribonuclease YbeY protein [Haloplasma contractile SSD-17B]
MIEVAYINETDKNVEDYIDIIQSVCDQIEQVEQLERKDYEVAIIFVENEKIKQINHDYRGKDCVTDVISFAMLDDLSKEPSLEDALHIQLGDVFICIDQAIKQAFEYGHSLKREVGFLACHGLLHLLGYDHQTKEEEDIMFTKQEMILNETNLGRQQNHQGDS